MRRLFFISLIVFFSMNFVSAEYYNFTIDKSIHNSGSVKFLEHTGDGPFDSYLILNLPFKPAKELHSCLQKKLGTPLKSRGEAHITVITPVEYFNVLKKHLTIDDINKIAKHMYIQHSMFSITCIGSGQKKLNGKVESTYYVVVESNDLLQIRKKVWELYVARGGNPKDFCYKKYYPHITLGFTKRDLHESDGIIKDKSSFFAALTEK